MRKAVMSIWCLLCFLTFTSNSSAFSNSPANDLAAEDNYNISADSDREEVHHAHDHEFHEQHVAPPEPVIIPPSIHSNALRSSRFICNDNAFATSGQDLINAITTQGLSCVGRLFSRATASVRSTTFTAANLTTVANEARSRSILYDGTDPDGSLSAMYYWIRAAFYYDADGFRIPSTQIPVVAAIRALTANSHFYDKTAENALVVYHASVNIRNAAVGSHFVGVTEDLLRRYDESYEAVANWGAAMAQFTWFPLQDCSRLPSCRSAEYDAGLVKLIGDFIYDHINWLDTPNTDYHLFNTSYHLAKIYSGRIDPGFSALEPELQFQLNRIFTEFGPYSGNTGRRSYLSALQSLMTFGSCDDYGLCSKRQEVLDTVLDNRTNCPSGTLFMWAQDMSVTEMNWVCSTLVPQENYFHDVQQTGRIPVVPDDNDQLRMIIFDDSIEWKMYGGFLFGASTDNGGLYLEGNPAIGGDQATFFAYENTFTRPIFDVKNLHHEYIHYLDGRYIEWGGFSDFLGAGRTVWYLEGTAEYMARKDCNSDAIAEARLGTYALSTIFQNTYSSGQTRIYRWGYLANRFMFERHNAEYFQMLELFKQGRFEEYRNTLVDVWVDNQMFDAEFADWLTSAESTGCTVDTTRPISPHGDQVGVNACANGGIVDEALVFSLGEAVCLPSITNGDDLDKAIFIDAELSGYTLEFTLRHGTGDTTLSFSHGYRPTASRNDAQEGGAGTEKTFAVNSVKSGWNYINIQGEPNFSGVTLLAQVKTNDAPALMPPIAIVNGPYSANTGSSVAFSSAGSADSDGTIMSYLWQFGDGQSSILANPEHAYVASGTYIATLRVTDNDGLETTASTTVNISEPVATGDACATQAAEDISRIYFDQSYCLADRSGGNQIQLAILVDSATVRKRLEFRLANGSGNAILLHKYDSRPSPADYDHISDGPGNDEVIVIESAQAGWNYIHILADPAFSGVTLSTSILGSGPAVVAPNANINGPYLGTTGNRVAFSSAGSGDSDGVITNYYWDFGDGQFSENPNPVYTYATAGVYTVTLRVTDDDGLIATDISEVTIRDPIALDDVCATQSPTSISVLDLGESYCLVSRDGGNQLQMAMYIDRDAAEKRVEIRLRYGSGNADLLHLFDSRPTRDIYDYISDSPDNHEVIIVESAQEGWNYIHVVAAMEFSDVTLSSRILASGPADESADTNSDTASTQTNGFGESSSGAGSIGIWFIILLWVMRRIRLGLNRQTAHTGANY